MGDKKKNKTAGDTLDIAELRALYSSKNNPTPGRPADPASNNPTLDPKKP